MDQRNITNFLTFMRMHLAEILFVFLFGIAFSPVPVAGNNIITARLDDSIDSEIRKGYVELSVDGVNWYKLCDDGHSSSPYFKVASIVCQQLGYGPPVLAAGHIEADDDKQYLQFEDEWCNVTHKQVLQKCSLEGSSATVPDSCYGRIMYVACLPAAADEYDVALVVDDSFGSSEGLVLIHVNEHWGPICSGSAGDTVCRQLGYGMAYSSIFHGDVSSDTYASPVLRHLFCYSSDETIEECIKDSEMTDVCSPDGYLKVSCKESDYSEDDHGSGFRPRSISPSYFIFLVVIVLSLGVLFRVYAAKARAQQRQQNPVGATGVQTLSTTVNQQSGTSRLATANYPRQQTQPFTFQGYQPSGMQQAASVPPYPATSYQSPPAPYPPPPNDSELPSYDDAVKNQTHTA